MSYNSINKVDINGVEYILHDLTDGTYIVKIPELTKDETFAIQSKVNSDLYKKVDKISGKALSTNDFTNEYKSKLDGIEDNANKYIHPSYTTYDPGFYKVTVDDKGHVSSAVKVEKSDITALGIPGQDTTYVDMVGATSSADGKNGLVPAPSKGDATRYLRSDGTWVVPPDTTYPLVTTSDKGLMSPEDKDKLDNIEASANNYSLPTATSTVLGGVKIGTNIAIANSIISVANASTSTKGVVQLNSSIESSSETTAATSKAVKSVNDKVNALDTIANAALAKSGGTMTGAIDMGGNNITDVAAPINDTDAANKQYVDSVVPNLNVAVDSALSATSTNPVRNKVVTESLNNKVNKIVPSAANNVALLDADGNLVDSGKQTSDLQKATGIIDYTNSDKVIQVGWSGDSIAASAVKYVAGYTDTGNIKDIKLADLKTALGMSSGTWTPEVTGATSYSTQLGIYLKFGNYVIVHFSLYGKFGGSTSETVKITGCPFAPTNNNTSGGGNFSGYTADGSTVFSGWSISKNNNIYPVGQQINSSTSGTKWATNNLYQGATNDFLASGLLMFETAQ